MNKFLLSLLSLSIFLLLSPLRVYGYYTGMSADLVLGQADFTSGSANRGGSVGANTLSNPFGIFYDQDTGKLFVTDRTNNRVLIYNRLPESNSALPDVVIGQQNFTSSSANQGGSVAANTLSSPTHIFVDKGKVFISDTTNQRVLIFNTIPTSNNASADVVVGQPNFTSSSQNQGGGATSTNGYSLRFPTGVYANGSKLFINDLGNSRVLIYNNIPSSNNPHADVVVGQTNFTNLSANQGGTPGPNTLSPADGNMIVLDGKLIIADHVNHRVLIFNTIPTSNNASADVVLGQVDFATVNSTGMTGYNNTRRPIALASDGKRLFVATNFSSRVIVYNSIPTANSTPHDLVLGQPNLFDNTGRTTSTGMGNPNGITVANNKFIVADGSNNRILIYNNILSSPHLSISKVEQLSGDSGKLKITGSTEIGERGRYSLSSVVASVNGLGYGNVTSKDNGRDNGDGKTLYEFTHEFEPWVNNNGDKNTWKDKGYTVALKAISSNAEEDEVLLFSPFTLKTTSKDSSSLEFVVPSAHWSTLVDKLSYYTVEVKKSGSKEWTKLFTPIPTSLTTNTSSDFTVTHNSSTGTITVKSSKTLPSGEYRIQAVSKTGSSFSSNVVSYVLTTPNAYTFIPSVSSFHLSLTSISNLNPQLSSYLKPSKVDFYSKLSSVSTTFKGIAYANSTVTLTLIQQNCSSSCTHTYTTTTRPNSTFSLVVPNKDLLSNKKYTGFLTATLNKQEASVAPFTFSVN